MTDPATVGEIISQYERHGWILRRALLSAEGRERLTDALALIAIVSSDVDALWFSRKSQPGSVAWELRRLTNLPFALVAVIPDDATDEEVESTLEQVVDEMRAKTFA